MNSTPCSDKLKFFCKRTDEFFENQDKIEAEMLAKNSQNQLEAQLKEDDGRNGKAPSLGRARPSNIRIGIPFGGYG